MVLELSEGFRKQLTINHQRFRIDFSPVDGDFSISADKNQVEVIIKNLISNSIKYGETDTTIDIKIFQHQKKGIVVSNAVSQTIADSEKLKGRFLRDSSHKEGFGLGLWISEILSEKNNARLSLDTLDKRFYAMLEFDEF
jgi:signal transduction histidine kinase